MQAQFLTNTGGDLRRLKFCETSRSNFFSELSKGPIIVYEPARYNFDRGPFAYQLVVDLAVLEKGVESSLVKIVGQQVLFHTSQHRAVLLDFAKNFACGPSEHSLHFRA